MRYVPTKEIIEQLKREAKQRIGDVEFSALLSIAASRIESLNRDNLEMEASLNKRRFG